MYSVDALNQPTYKVSSSSTWLKTVAGNMQWYQISISNFESSFRLFNLVERRKLQKINHYADTHLNTFGYTTKDISNEDRQ